MKAGKTSNLSFSRREFLKTSAAVSIAAMANRLPNVYAAGSDKLRLGVIGCGGRGLYDSTRCLNADPGVELIAMADLFRDRLDDTLAKLKQEFPDRIKVTNETSFVGFDAYKNLLATNVDMVILTEPPHFRPMHLKAAIEAGKHVFMEKPVAVDPVGVRSVIASSELAESKGLTIVGGTQARRLAHRVEIMKRIHNGDIGDITAGQCVRISGAMLNWGPQTRKADWSDMEWQIRRWLFMTWLSGDFINEMHIHELDIVNWAMGSPPVKCIGNGGRLVRTDPLYGDVYDHFACEFEYSNGAKVNYLGSQIDGVSGRCNEYFVGTNGSAYTDWGTSYIKGPNEYQYDGPVPDPCIRQHADQIAAIRSGSKLNEGKRVAESTLTAIMGRICAYTGRAISWNWLMNSSKLDLSPEKYQFGDLPEPMVSMPGKTKLI